MTFGSAQSVKRTHAYDPPPPNGFRTVWLFLIIFLSFIFICTEF